MTADCPTHGGNVTRYAAAEASSPGATDEKPSAAHIAPRTRTAGAPVSWLATMTPSIMSAATATHGLPRTRIDTAPPRSERCRRIDRSTPTRRGGQRNDGDTKPLARHTRASDRAASVNWIVVVV